MKIINNFSKEEEISHSITHAIGAIISVVGFIFLMIKAYIIKDTLHTVSYIIFGLSLINLYTMSSIYHAFPKGKSKKIFEKFDHISIYFLIAGSYTPFCLILLNNKIGWTIFIIQWIFVLIGTIFKSIWVHKYVGFATIIYIIMGWMIVFSIKPLLPVLSINGFIFLTIGGIFYTLGTIFFAFRLFKYHHTVWHIFVLFGSIFHYLTIYFYV
ncbi:hemolysin III [Hypnocyclicus thermotrophus]|uniref:Hemolysin III n=1 Tax=Hypnocyclicus thermotrophus TaxID=1627895 RepID=A0AA46DZD7_9FUSO|nr:hemolysin III family protein [Hypnocyclicus thermotrophus]TDT71782.1 hemolysin III [Hypnocyclicus thermotrophus]